VRAAPLDLHEHLLWQLRLSHLEPRDQQIGAALIEAIGDDGYLRGGSRTSRRPCAGDRRIRG
jgi:DNA-directed RNA polymerase specialized sigma54-like protein